MEFVFAYGIVIVCVLYGLSVAFMAGMFTELGKNERGKDPDMFLVVVCAIIWPVTIFTFFCYCLGIAVSRWLFPNDDDAPPQKEYKQKYDA